jgi:hypothetical protein
MSNFLKAAKRKVTEPIEIDGEKAFVRCLSIKELDDISAPFQKDKDKDPGDLTRQLVYACLVDEKGKQILGSTAEVQELSPPAFKLISEAVAKVNGFNIQGN